MARVRIRVDDERARRTLGAITPKNHPEIFRGALIDMADDVQKYARTTRFLDGGGLPVRGILTNRSGDARRSIFQGRKNLPRSIAVDSHDVALYVHEFGTSKYPKRAVLLPALNDVSLTFEGTLLKHIDRAIGKT